jgi:hypothetical protein
MDGGGPFRDERLVELFGGELEALEDWRLR